jgi:hypothetical protein
MCLVNIFVCGEDLRSRKESLSHHAFLSVGAKCCFTGLFFTEIADAAAASRLLLQMKFLNADSRLDGLGLDRCSYFNVSVFCILRVFLDHQAVTPVAMFRFLLILGNE